MCSSVGDGKRWAPECSGATRLVINRVSAQLVRDLQDDTDSSISMKCDALEADLLVYRRGGERDEQSKR